MKRKKEQQKLLPFHSHSFSSHLICKVLCILMDLKGVPRHAVHTLTGIPHATIERLHSRLTTHIANWVETKQRTINLGMERRWVDVEADEVTFAKRLCGRTLTKSNPEIAPISVRTTQLCFLYLSCSSVSSGTAFSNALSNWVVE